MDFPFIFASSMMTMAVRVEFCLPSIREEAFRDATRRMTSKRFFISSEKFSPGGESTLNRIAALTALQPSDCITRRRFSERLIHNGEIYLPANICSKIENIANMKFIEQTLHFTLRGWGRTRFYRLINVPFHRRSSARKKEAAANATCK